MIPGQRFRPYKTFVGSFIPNWLIEWPERGPEKLSAGAKLLWARLAQHEGKDGGCWPSQETLAEELGGTTDREIRKRLTELERVGLIEIEQRGLNRSNLYHFLWHRRMEEAALHPDSPIRNERSGSARNERSGKEVQVLRDSKNLKTPATPARSAGPSEPCEGKSQNHASRSLGGGSEGFGLSLGGGPSSLERSAPRPDGSDVEALVAALMEWYRKYDCHSPVTFEAICRAAIRKLGVDVVRAIWRTARNAGVLVTKDTAGRVAGLFPPAHPGVLIDLLRIVSGWDGPVSVDRVLREINEDYPGVRGWAAPEEVLA